MASYNNNEDAPHEPDGVALVWNMKYKKPTPEYIFHCQVKDAFQVQKASLLSTWNKKYLRHYCCLSPVWSDVSRLCKVSPQPCGGWDILGTDSIVGQQEQQAHPCAEDSPVCSCTHSNALDHTIFHCLHTLFFSCIFLIYELCTTVCSTQSTAWMWWEPKMPTTWSAFPLMARCAPGAWTCSPSHRYTRCMDACTDMQT